MIKRNFGMVQKLFVHPSHCLQTIIQTCIIRSLVIIKFTIRYKKVVCWIVFYNS